MAGSCVCNFAFVRKECCRARNTSVQERGQGERVKEEGGRKRSEVTQGKDNAATAALLILHSPVSYA